MIDGLHVEIYINDSSTLIMSIYALKVFIGKSIKNQMTIYSGGYGSQFDGNSILLQTGVNKYIYIGSSIFEFTSYNEIVIFISNVGNNDVPYPYAVDCDDTYYLLIEKVVAHHIHPTFNPDPYRIYYDKSKIINIKTQKQYKNIVAYYLLDTKCKDENEDNNESYNLSYMSNPSERYDLLKNDSLRVVIKKEDGKKYELSKQEYCDIINEFGDMNGFEPLNITRMISKRLM